MRLPIGFPGRRLPPPFRSALSALLILLAAVAVPPAGSLRAQEAAPGGAGAARAGEAGGDGAVAPAPPAAAPAAAMPAAGPPPGGATAAGTPEAAPPAAEPAPEPARPPPRRRTWQVAPRPSAAPAPAVAPTPALPQGGDAAHLLAVLQDEARRAELVRSLRALAAAQGTAQGTLGAAAAPAPAPAAPAAERDEALIEPATLGAQLLVGASRRLGALSDQLVGAAQALTDLPGLLARLGDLARDPVTRARLADASWKLVVVFGLGVLAEWLAARALRRPRDALDALAPAEGPGTGGWRAGLRRVPLLVARCLLDLLPVAAFAVVSWGLVGAVRPLPSTELVMLTVNQAYVGTRAVMALCRMLLSPNSAHLRLLPCGDETAAYVTVWLRRVVAVAVSGYAVAQAALLFGLPWSAHDLILKGVALVVVVFVAIVALQNRAAVADWLRAPPLAAGDEPDRARRLVRGLRDRVAGVWHWFAILYLVALWAVAALEVADGAARLTRVSLLTLAIVAAARLVDEALRRTVQRGFRIGPDMRRRWPGLETRANRYVPVMQGALTAAVVVLAAMALLEAWGIEAFEWFAQGRPGNRLLGGAVSVALTVGFAALAWEAANAAIARHLARLSRDAQGARSARVRTLLPMLRTVLLVVILVLVALNVLTEIGVNVAPLLAGAGVVGLALGFGSQKLVQDVITGVFLLFEDAVAVGDTVTLGGQTGVVEQLSIRSIKLRLLDGGLHIVPFSAVTTVTNQTRDFAFAVVDVPVLYAEDAERVFAALREVGARMRAEPRWATAMRDDLDVMGVDRLTEQGQVIRARVKTEPSQRLPVARELNRRVLRRFTELGIGVATTIDRASPEAHPAPA